LLEKHLDVIIGKTPCSSGTYDILLYTLEIQKVGLSTKGEWFIPIEFQQKLSDLIIEKTTETERKREEKIAKIETTCITPPNYATPIIKKAYDASVSGEYTAEENGWVFARAYSNNTWISFFVNGHNVTSGGGDALFYGNAHFFAAHQKKKSREQAAMPKQRESKKAEPSPFPRNTAQNLPG
jgi:hypothetical protein